LSFYHIDSPELRNDVTVKCNTAIIYDNDVDFAEVMVIVTPVCMNGDLLPSQEIEPETLSHLTVSQRSELLQVLDTRMYLPIHLGYVP